MKTTKLIFPLALALAATLAATGCKHITRRRHQSAGTRCRRRRRDRHSDARCRRAPTINPERIPTGGDASWPITEEFDNMMADRAALAAYTIHFAYDSAVIREQRKGESAKPWRRH